MLSLVIPRRGGRFVTVRSSSWSLPRSLQGPHRQAQPQHCQANAQRLVSTLRKPRRTGRTRVPRLNQAHRLVPPFVSPAPQAYRGSFPPVSPALQACRGVSTPCSAPAPRLSSRALAPPLCKSCPKACRGIITPCSVPAPRLSARGRAPPSVSPVLRRAGASVHPVQAPHRG